GRRPQERSETQAQDEPDADACANGAGGEKTCGTNHETTLLTSGQRRKWALPTRQPPEIGIVSARGRRSAMAARPLDLSPEQALGAPLGLWALGSGLWALGSGLWALGSGLGHAAKLTEIVPAVKRPFDCG